MTTQPGPASNASWKRDEVAGAGRENLDRAHVARDDAKENASAAAEVALLRACLLGPQSTVVELGAGTGQFALAVAAHCRQVVGVDVSPAMLEWVGFTIETAERSDDRMFAAYVARAT